MKENFLALQKEAQEAFNNIESDDTTAQEAWRSLYLGRKGKTAQLMKQLGALSSQEKKEVGSIANSVKQELLNLLKEGTACKERSLIDISLPGRIPVPGHEHPLYQVLDRVISVFLGMGFDVVEGPEVELSQYNFDALNIPKDHPARDMWDTFYVRHGKEESGVLLRTHTSPVQIRAMEHRTPPVRLIVPGRVFRHEATDATHGSNFFQLEGLMIDHGIRVTDLMGCLEAAMKGLYGSDTHVRLRPSYFPFVEPGFEVDVSCMMCGGKTTPSPLLVKEGISGRYEGGGRREAGCSVCKGTGWVEMLGAGMVHPVVLKNMKVDSRKYSGFAFGMGIDRMMMLAYGIPDIRLGYSGDVEFVRQF